MHLRKWALEARKAGNAMPSVMERFEEKVFREPNSGCWLWLGFINEDGYGRFSQTREKPKLAHRFSYEYFVGPIPRGLEIDHKCRVRCCVRPDHLEPITHLENIQRGTCGDRGKNNKTKTCCPKGHPYSTENTIVNRKGWRHCRTCRNLNRRTDNA